MLANASPQRGADRAALNQRFEFGITDGEPHATRRIAPEGACQRRTRHIPITAARAANRAAASLLSPSLPDLCNEHFPHTSGETGRATHDVVTPLRGSFVWLVSVGSSRT